MSEVCKDCRHWMAPREMAAPAQAACALVGKFDVRRPLGKRIAGIATSNVQEGAVFVTAPDYGCNQFEAKPE